MLVSDAWAVYIQAANNISSSVMPVLGRLESHHTFMESTSATDQPRPARYPLLETILAHRGLSLKGAFTIRDVAALFDVSTRTIQVRVKRGDLQSRDLPGRTKFLAIDIENFLQGSSRGTADPS
jgi:hypothetical protein